MKLYMIKCTTKFTVNGPPVITTIHIIEGEGIAARVDKIREENNFASVEVTSFDCLILEIE